MDDFHPVSIIKSFRIPSPDSRERPGRVPALSLPEYDDFSSLSTIGLFVAIGNVETISVQDVS